MAAKKNTKKSEKPKSSDIKLVKQNTKELLKLLSLDVEVSVSEDKDNEAVLVDIQSEEEAGLLIGNRGRTLNSIQLLLGMMYMKQVGDWKRILVNVADWRERERERIESLAKQVAERAVSTKERQTLYNLTSAQRRIVHMVLAEDSTVRTESEGEGRDRCLVVYPE